MHFHFPEGRRAGREVLTVSGLAKSYGGRPVFADVGFSVQRGEKVALLGVNGAGKSTLTRILAGEEAPGAGTVQWGYQVQAAFFSQESQQNLDYGGTVWQEAREAAAGATDLEVRNLLGAFLFSGDDILKSVAVLSGGEKSRLALVKILLRDSNCLILDEPTNHLDLKTKEIFQDALLHYSGTIILVSHDRHFLDDLVVRVLELRDGRIHEYLGNYSEFVRKREQEAAAVEAERDAAPRPDGAGSRPEPRADATGENGAPGARRPGRSREERRLEAEERNRIGRVRRELAGRVQALEAEIGGLETTRTRSHGLLCDAKVLRDSPRVQEIMKELGGAEARLKELLPEWERLMAQLEELKTI